MSRWLALALGLAAAPAPAASPDPSSLRVPAADAARARDLVRRLGSEDFRERDRATRELRAMGRLALPALADGVATGDDPELRVRCEWLLPAAAAADRDARVAAFLADADGRFDHDLPGWDRFRAAAGADDAARALFAELLKKPENSGLLAATGRPAAELGKAVAARRQQLQARITPVFRGPGPFTPAMPDLADVAALLFAESLVPEKLAPFEGLQYHVSNFLYQPAGREAAAGTGRFGPPFRKLTVRWLDTRDGPNGLMTALSLSQTLALGPAEVGRYAARVLDSGTHPWNKAAAVGAVAKNQRREHLPAVVKLFDGDDLLVRGNPNQPDVRLADFALAMAALMTNQDPKAYGLELANATEPAKYTATTYRFRDDDAGTAADKRAAARKKWQAWEAEQAKRR